MKLGIYAIKDTAVGRFSPGLIVLDNDEVAKRTFATAINSGSQSQIAVYYKDMQLWKISDFEDRTGEVNTDTYLVCSGVDVKDVTTKGDEDGSNTSSEDTNV